MNHKIHDDMTQDEAISIHQMIIESTDHVPPSHTDNEFGVVLRDKNGNVKAGTTANVVWNFLQIDVLWMPEELRGQCFGHQLLEQIEEMGRSRGCISAKHDVLEFEEIEFYKRHSYEFEFQSDEFPQDHIQCLQKKVL